MSGKKSLQSIAGSSILDVGAKYLSGKFGGRGTTMKRLNTKSGKATAKRQAKAAVKRLIAIYGVEATKKIVRSYIKSRGRGVLGGVLGGILGKIIPF